MALPEVCVVYILKRVSDGPSEVLLGMKKAGLGVGKYVGIGGKLEPGESPADAAVREVQEESSLVLDQADLRAAGVTDYYFPTKLSWSQRSHVFVCEKWDGEPADSDELVRRWFRVDEIPFDPGALRRLHGHDCAGRRDLLHRRGDARVQ